MFTPFFTTKPPGIGTGLDLPICQRIIGQMGGKIEVESELGRGSTFRVVLRRRRRASVDGQHPARFGGLRPRRRRKRRRARARRRRRGDARGRDPARAHAPARRGRHDHARGRGARKAARRSHVRHHFLGFDDAAGHRDGALRADRAGLPRARAARNLPHRWRVHPSRSRLPRSKIPNPTLEKPINCDRASSRSSPIGCKEAAASIAV